MYTQTQKRMHTPTKRIEVFTKSCYLTTFLQVPSHGNILEGTFFWYICERKQCPQTAVSR